MIGRALGLETRKLPASGDHWGWSRLYGLGGGLPTESGAQVSEGTALAISTVYSCVRFLAFNVAALPLVLYQKTGEDTRRKATDHPTSKVLSKLCNRRQTAFQARAFTLSQVLLRGNGLAFVEKNDRGRAVALWPLRWDRTTLDRDQAGRLVYTWSPSGAAGETFLESEVWHPIGLSQDGVQGISPIAACRETFGSAISARDYASRFWRNGGMPAGVLTHPTTLGKTNEDRKAAAERLRVGWDESYGGTERAHRVAILEEDMKFQAISLTPEATQVLETRKFSRSEIAAIFGVPPHLIGDLDRATFGNIEQQSLELVIYHLTPLLVSLEQTLERDLLPEEDRAAGYYIKHNVDGLLRGDSTARANFYRSAVQTPFMTVNEVRALDELEPLEGGDELRFPLNVSTDVGGDPSSSAVPPGLPGGSPARPAPGDPEPRAARQDPPTPAPAPAPGRPELARIFVPLLEDAFGRLVNREVRELRKKLGLHLDENSRHAPPRFLGRRSADTMQLDLEDFYSLGSDFYGLAQRTLTPPVAALVRASFDRAAAELDQEPNRNGLESFVAGMVAAVVDRYTISSRKQLVPIVQGESDDLAAEALAALFAKWIETRPTRASARESVQSSRAAAVEAYRRGGVQSKRWVTRGEDCGFCQALDGEVVGVTGVFLEAGQTLVGTDGRTLTAKGRIGHAPLHRGCDCDVVKA